MSDFRWNQTPIYNAIMDILVKNKGEILDKRLEELLKKEFPYINALALEELYMKLECRNILNVFRVSKNKNMIVLNKRTQAINENIKKDL